MDPLALLDASSELLCVTDAGWIVQHANRRWEDVLGYAPDTLKGGSLRTLLHPDDRRALESAVDSSPGVGPVPPFVARLLAGDGSYQALDWRVTRREGGALYLALRLCWEIESVEEELRESYHRLRSLVERSLDAFFIKDLDGRYQFINPSGAAYLGRRVEDVLSRTDEEVFSPEIAADITRVDRQVLEAGEPVTYQPMMGDFGDRRAFLTTKYPFHDRFGKLAGLMGVSHDVTAWIAAQESARRSDASFRRLVEASPDLVIVHEGGSVVYANPSAVDSLGCASMDELVGTHLLDLIRPTDREMLSMEETGEFSPIPPVSRVQEVGLNRRDGAVLQAEIVELEVQWEGTVAQALVARDISERRQLEAQLAQADRLASVGTLAAGVAHEINNPLTYVIHHLQEIEHGLAGRDGALSLLAGEAATGAQRIRTIVRDLMLFARQEQSGDESTVDIHEVLERAIKLGFNQIRHRARLVRDYGGVALVAGEPGRLSQVFLNLLVNAAQAMALGDAENNEIRVTTRLGDRCVRVEIRDTGPGIPPALRDRIFEPFTTTKSVGEGTGLGLWICHSMVKEAGGRIDCETELGRGTAFTVCLPLASGASPQPPPASPQTEGRLPPGLRLLVVDDEVLIGRLIQAGLEDEAEVVAVSSGREALELLQGDQRFDVILSDLMMPDVTGMELHACLLADSPHLAARMVFMTGGAFTAEDRRFLDGVEGRRVAKPFSMADIRKAIVARAGGLDPK